MQLLAVNGGVLFIPKNEKEIYTLESIYKAKPSVYGYWIPESINQYFMGYVDEDNYSFYFDKFQDKNGIKLYYNLGLKAVTSRPTLLEDGLYNVPVSDAGFPSFGLMVMQSHRDFAEVFNKPLHIELITALKDVIKLKTEFEALHKSVLQVVEAINNDNNSIRDAILQIAISIQTIPAVVGSPINAGLIVNTTATAIAKINQYEQKNDNVADYITDSNEILNDAIAEVVNK